MTICILNHFFWSEVFSFGLFVVVSMQDTYFIHKCTNGSIAIGQVATFKASFIQAHNFLKLLGPLELEIFRSFL
jgi:hypothetical protein